MPSNSPRAKNWCFTLNNWTTEDVDRIMALADTGTVKYCVFGKEVGENGTPHLQGFIQFDERMRMNKVKEALGRNPHVEVARSLQKSVNYCKKDGDFEEFGSFAEKQGNRTDLELFIEAVKGGEIDRKVLRETHPEVMARYPRYAIELINDNAPGKELEPHPWRPWQAELNEYLNRPPDDRTITFVVDTVGNSGKTWFAHFYAQTHERVQVMNPTKKADMAFALDPTIRVLFMDAPRSKQGDFILYDFLEEVKNGWVFSNKYESHIKKLGKVHVVVLMNEEPKDGQLSVDRVRVIRPTRH